MGFFIDALYQVEEVSLSSLKKKNLNHEWGLDFFVIGFDLLLICYNVFSAVVSCLVMSLSDFGLIK